MENKIDIGKAFREKMDQLEKSPSDNLWANIEKDLETKRNRRFPFFWILSSILISGLFLGGLYFYNTSSNDQNQLEHNSNSSTNQLTDTPEENGTNPILKNKNQSNRIENEGIQNKSIENISANHISTQEKTSNSNTIVASDSNDSSPKISAKKSSNKNSLVHDSTSTKKTKYKQNTSKSKTISSKAKTSYKGKTTFSYETTKLVKNTKRLVKSTEDYEEYEIVKQ